MKKERIEEIKVEERFCDDCGAPAPHQCIDCGKDICGWQQNGCATVVPETEHGDYPDYRCKECVERRRPYQQRIDELYDKIDKIETEYSELTEKIRQLKEINEGD
jgi:hypothetical protein